MISTEPVRMIRRYPTGAVPCEKIAFPAGNSSSSATAANGGCEPRKPVMSSIGLGSGLLTSGGYPGGRHAGLVLGQDRGRAAAQRDEVVDGPRAAEEADENERSPLVVPMVAAVDGHPRPEQVDHDNCLEDDGQHVHRQPPAAQ